MDHSITDEINKLLHGDEEVASTSFNDAIEFSQKTEPINIPKNTLPKFDIEDDEDDFTTEIGVQTEPTKSKVSFSNFLPPNDVQPTMKFVDFQFGLLKIYLEKDETIRQLIYNSFGGSIDNLSREDVKYLLIVLSKYQSCLFNTQRTLEFCKSGFILASIIYKWIEPENGKVIEDELNELMKLITDRDYNTDIINGITSCTNLEFEPSNPAKQTAILILQYGLNVALRKFPKLPEIYSNYSKKRKFNNEYSIFNSD